MKRVVASATVAAMLAVLLALTPALGIAPLGSSDPDDAQTLFPITPCGVFDSRPNQGGAGIFNAGDSRTVQLEATTACPDVPADATGFLISVIAVNAAGPGSVKVWPTDQTEPAAGGVSAFSTTDFAPANTITVADGGDPDDVTVKVLANAANVKIVLLGYYLPGTDVYESFDRTIVVDGAATPADNGTALTDALATLTGANTPTATDPWQIQLQPGTYDITTAGGITIPPFVTLTGAGPNATTITCTTTCTSPVVPAVTGSSNTTIGHLAIEGAFRSLEYNGVSSAAVRAVRVDGGIDVDASDVDFDHLVTTGFNKNLALRSSSEVVVRDGVTTAKVTVSSSSSLVMYDTSVESGSDVIVSNASFVMRGGRVQIGALDGSAVKADTGARVDISDAEILSFAGGALWADAATIDARGVTITTGNSPSVDGGPVVKATDGGSVRLSDSVGFAEGTTAPAASADAGSLVFEDVILTSTQATGIDLDNGAELSARGLSVFTPGTALDLDASEATVHNAVLETGNGTAVDLSNSSELTLDDSDVTALTGGYALWNKGSTVRVDDSRLDAADTSAGWAGIYQSGSGSSLELNDTDVASGISTGVDVDAGEASIHGGEITASSGIDASSPVTVRGTRIDAALLGIQLNGSGLVEVFDTIIDAGTDAVFSSSAGSIAILYGSEIHADDTAGDGVINTAGLVQVLGGVLGGTVTAGVSDTCMGVSYAGALITGPTSCPAPPP